MSRKQEDPRREMTQAEQHEGYISRRMRAFGERSREPGDAATWAVVLGAFMWTLLIVCLSVSDQSFLAFISFILTLVWVVLMGRFGKVNVASILWGSATSDADNPPVENVVFHLTLAVALISLIAVVVDALGGWNFGWYGVALIIAVAVYLVIYLQSWFQSVR